MDTPENIKEAIVRARYADMSKKVDDHEDRMRTVEEAITKFNFILYLTLGGGALSLINLMAVLVLIGMAVLNAR